MKKADIKRLQRMLKELEEDESFMQGKYGDKVGRSTREKAFLDAEALRRALDELA